MRSHICGSPEIDFKAHIDRKQLRFMGDAAAYAYIAMQQAIDDAGLAADEISNERTGIIAGSGGASSAKQVEAADIRVATAPHRKRLLPLPEHFESHGEGRVSDGDPIVCFPLRQGTRVVGAIAIWGFWIQKEELSELDQRMFQLLATSGGHALEAARLAAHDSEQSPASNGGSPFELYSALLV